MFGLMAYPSMGIYKSLKKKNANQAEAKLSKSQIALGEYTLGQLPPGPEEIQMVLSKFRGIS
jgi:hypothetical protein